jgi:methyl-accepting chemotaxis protein
MSFLRNLPIARKFLYAFGAVCALCVLLGVYTFSAFHQIADKCIDVRDNALPSIVLLSDARGAMNILRRQDIDLALCQTSDCVATHTSQRQQALVDYQTAIKKYEPMASYPGEQDLYQKLTAAYAQYEDVSNRGAALVAGGKAHDAQSLIMGDSTVAMFGTVLDTLNADFTLNVKYGGISAQDTVTTSNRATWINLTVTIVIIGLCALIGIALTRVIAPRLAAATDALELMAQKDLTASIDVSGTDEIGRMGEALNTSLSTLRSLLQSVARSARPCPRPPRKSARAPCRRPATHAPSPARSTRLPPPCRR